jgi:UDP-3-O-[3-hydroxymyristoyl] glucosamine N-acyltransferase
MPARFTLKELVDRFGGSCGGDLERSVVGFAAIEDATTDHLAFVTATRYRDAIKATSASAVLVTKKDAEGFESHADRLWICRDPYLQFARIAQFFEDANRRAPAPGIDPLARVDAGARIDPGARVESHAVIGADAVIGPAAHIGAGTIVGAGSTVGENTLLYPKVVVYPGCSIGARCIVHSGAVIGADGFGFAKDGPRWIKIPQVGGVSIGDDVEIGANTTIDRGALNDTRIGNGVKLDNQIQIGHNVQVGEHTIMAAFVGVAGSAIIGSRCMIGGAARIMGHVTIADDVVVSTQTFVSRSITKPGQYTGYYPMSEHAAFEKSAAVLRRLDTLRERVRKLEAALASATHKPPEPESLA